MDTMEAIYPCVSGLDVHKQTVVACRRRLSEGGQVEKEVQTFGTTTASVPVGTVSDNLYSSSP